MKASEMDWDAAAIMVSDERSDTGEASSIGVNGNRVIIEGAVKASESEKYWVREVEACGWYSLFSDSGCPPGKSMMVGASKDLRETVPKDSTCRDITDCHANPLKLLRKCGEARTRKWNIMAGNSTQQN